MAWRPATPLLLEARRCYWVVLSTESGEVLQWISTTQPVGEAAVLGRSYTQNAGVTWSTSDPYTYPMIIRATPVSSLPGQNLAASLSTPIPGGVGNFSGLPYAPSFSGGHLAFHGSGVSGQQGLYLAPRLVPGLPYRIADLNTPIPSGAGNFLSFGSEAGIIIVSGNSGIFIGTGGNGQKGIYSTIMAPPQIGLPARIADKSTLVPGGSGAFSDFSSELDVSGTNVVFAGTDQAGHSGIYAAVIAPDQVVSSPVRVADTATPIPSGEGAFTDLRGPAVSGDTAVFAGQGSGGQQGVYAAIISAPQAPVRIADTSTPIPGGAGSFLSFGTEAGIIIVSGKSAFFRGQGSGGQKGIYGAKLVTGGLRAASLNTADLGVDPVFLIADISTPIPGGTGNFAEFGAMSGGDPGAAFLGLDSTGQTGIYYFDGVQLHKIIASGDALHEKTIARLSLSARGLSGNQIAFQATFSDDTQGIDTIDLPLPPSAPCRITAVEKAGNELRVSFTSVAGQTYEVQRRGDVASGAWSSLPGTAIVAADDKTEQTLTIDPGEPQQFYRIVASP